MKQEDKEKFLACLQQRQFPRQALLFEYVLNKLYDALSQNQGVKNIPQTTAMHLFLYTCLGSRLADSAPEKNIFHYFPRWYACFRRDFENYARFIPMQDFVNCPLLFIAFCSRGLRLLYRLFCSPRRNSVRRK